jgi:Mor family transcriptional regulator
MSAYKLEGDWRHRLRKRNAQMRADRPKMTIAALAAKYRVSYSRAYAIVCYVDGPRASSPRLHADRNAKIAAAYFNDVTIRELAQQYALTFQRIHQIVQRESTRFGRRALDRGGDVVVQTRTAESRRGSRSRLAYARAKDRKGSVANR